MLNQMHKMLLGMSCLLLLTACTVAPNDSARSSHTGVNASKSNQEDTAVAGSLSVMVLGSGGPVAAAAGRASASYLIYIDSEPKILMDVGGGAYQRLAKSSTNIKDLETILLSHLHVDHTADLSAFIKTLFFHNRQAGTLRTAPIYFYGPSANAGPGFSNTSDYISAHYDAPNGTERYLRAFAGLINAGEFNPVSKDINASFVAPAATQAVSNLAGVNITAIGLHHGPVPALGFRIDYTGLSVVYTGDTTSKTDNIIKLAMGADLLIYDTAIMADSPPPFSNLHTTPERIGKVAMAAGVKSLLLSHLTPVTDRNIANGTIQQIIRDQGYTGDIEIAADLEVFNLSAEDD